MKGVDYPIARAEILRAAREAGLGPTGQEALKNVPDREYADPGTSQELNAAA